MKHRIERAERLALRQHGPADWLGSVVDADGALVAVRYPDGTIHAAETLGEAERARLLTIPAATITMTFTNTDHPTRRTPGNRHTEGRFT